VADKLKLLLPAGEWCGQLWQRFALSEYVQVGVAQRWCSNTTENSYLLPNLNALAVVSNRMQAVKLFKQNVPVLNWGYRLTQTDLYNGHKMVVVVVVSSFE